ncbi:hypothetical protein D3C71_1609690 [compost metagenome]
MHDEPCNEQASCTDKQCGLNSNGFTHSTPAEAARRHGSVEYGQIDSKATPTHPVGQNSLGCPVQGRQGGDPSSTEEQKSDNGDDLRRGERKDTHDDCGDHRCAKKQTIRAQAFA